LLIALITLIAKGHANAFFQALSAALERSA